jgi:hypothetical protein
LQKNSTCFLHSNVPGGYSTVILCGPVYPNVPGFLYKYFCSPWYIGPVAATQPVAATSNVLHIVYSAPLQQLYWLCMFTVQNDTVSKLPAPLHLRYSLRHNSSRARASAPQDKYNLCYSSKFTIHNSVVTTVWSKKQCYWYLMYMSNDRLYELV